MLFSFLNYTLYNIYRHKHILTISITFKFFTLNMSDSLDLLLFSTYKVNCLFIDYFV